eukprot:scaffold6454_cov113-Isochrysis_galbana.AAC.8
MYPVGARRLLATCDWQRERARSPESQALYAKRVVFRPLCPIPPIALLRGGREPFHLCPRMVNHAALEVDVQIDCSVDVVPVARPPPHLPQAQPLAPPRLPVTPPGLAPARLRLPPARAQPPSHPKWSRAPHSTPSPSFAITDPLQRLCPCWPLAEALRPARCQHAERRATCRVKDRTREGSARAHSAASCVGEVDRSAPPPTPSARPPRYPPPPPSPSLLPGKASDPLPLPLFPREAPDPQPPPLARERACRRSRNAPASASRTGGRSTGRPGHLAGRGRGSGR